MQKRDRRKKFVELAQKRVNAAIRSIRLIGNLSDRGNYDYHPDDVRQIRSALESEVRESLSRFDRAKRSANPDFELDA